MKTFRKVAKVVVKKVVPPPIYRAAVRNAKYLMPDLFRWLIGRSDELIPPARKIFVGGAEDYRQAGEEFLGYFKDLGRLVPENSVLDIGSGIGRMAAPLTKYLGPGGTYDGFDIVPMGVEWCQKNITERFPNFRFQLADIYNKEYNPKGRLQASSFQFPYPDASKDFAFATSVFTHMFLEDIDHYLGEVSRVLKPSGRCLLTYFVINEESLRLVKDRKSGIHFDHLMSGIYVADRAVPEEAVGVPEGTIRNLYAKHGLTIENPIRYGSWCGREKFLSGQDLVVATKS